MRKAFFLNFLIIFSLLISCTQSGGLGVAPGEAPNTEGVSAPDSPQDPLPGDSLDLGGHPQGEFQAGEAGPPIVSAPIQHEGGTSGTITSTPGTLICNRGGLGAFMQTEEGDLLSASNLCVKVQVLNSSGAYGELAEEDLLFNAQVFNTLTKQWQPLPKCGEKNTGPNFPAVVFQVKILISPTVPSSEYCGAVGNRRYAIEGYYFGNKEVLLGREEGIVSSAPLMPDFIDPFILGLSHLNPVRVIDGPLKTPPSPFE